MFQPTSGGNGSSSGGGSGTYSNGYHRGGVGGGGQVTGNRVRRGSRGRSRDHGGGISPRVYQQQQQEIEKVPPPCTDFDVAYFNSYAHLGIHEEMIKVDSALCLCTLILNFEFR